MYRIVFKARVDTVFTSKNFGVSFFGETFNILQTVNWQNASSGSTTSTEWKPELTTTNTWHFADVKLSGNLEKLRFIIFIQGGNDIHVDEVYIFEKINVSTLIKFNSVKKSGDSVTGLYAAPDRTNFIAGVDDISLLQGSLSAENPFMAEFTGGIYPAYRIGISADEEAGEILLCEKWAMPFDPVEGFRPSLKKNHQKRITSASGIERRIRLFQRKSRKGTFEALSDADLKRYLEDWVPHHFDDDYPFAIQWEAGEAPMLMINADDTAGEIYNKLLPDWNFNFEEVI